ncbi:formylglycine-generating enzyme family protein [Pseudoalteromonas piscicida]
MINVYAKNLWIAHLWTRSDHQILPPLATLLCLVISGCDNLGRQIDAHTGEQDKQVQALIERTKAQMVFVEGGSFMMGDGGGPNNLPWTIARDNKPAHKVTLTSYSMGAYEVSYGDFDLYTTVNDLPKTMWEDWGKGEVWRAPEFPAGVSWYGGMFLESPRGSNVYTRQESDELDEAYRAKGFRCALNQAKPIPVQSIN